MENNSEKDTLLGGVAGLFTPMDAPKELNGFREYKDGEDDLTDEDITNIQKSLAGNLSSAFGVEPEEEEETEEEAAEEEVKKPKTKKTEKKKVTPEPIPEEDEEDEEDGFEDEEDEDETGDDVKDDKTKPNAFTAFFDVLNDELGIELGENEKKPTSAEEIADLIRETIQDNSIPTYASPEVEELDKFIRNGGKIQDYFTSVSEIDFDNFDLKSEANQEKIVKELLLEKGFTNTQVAKKLAKYKDADILSDEAEDALETLKEIREEKKEALLEDQKNKYQQQIKQQQKFFNDVIENVNNLENVRGIAIPKKDKEKLLAYVLKVDGEGKTQYQKDYEKNSIKNLLESAYFTMKGDTLLNAAEKTGRSAAIKAFKQSLDSTGNPAKGARRIKTQNNSTTFNRAVQQLFGSN